MTLVEHATREMRLAGWMDRGQEDPQTWIVENVLELIETFASQGHSGSSAPYVLSLFDTLARYQLLGPLTGEDDEWAEPYDSDGTQQNKRLSGVFRDAQGNAYDIGAKILEWPDGGQRNVRMPVSFPYTRQQIIEHVSDEEGPR